MSMFRSAGLFPVLMWLLPATASDVTLEQLRAGQAVLEAARNDYRQRADGLAPAEQADYASYIQRLYGRFAGDCMAARLAGMGLPPDLSCPEGGAPGAGPAAIDQQRERSRAEAAAALDAELDAGLGEFDQRLLREQQRVKADAPRSSAGNGGGAAGSAGESGDGGAEAAAGGDAKTPGDQAGSTSGGRVRAPDRRPDQMPPGATGPAGGRSGTLPPPPDIPDGSDDDVVARQLREAAQNESDPALREKLWDEYRKYKQGTR